MVRKLTHFLALYNLENFKQAQFCKVVMHQSLGYNLEQPTNIRLVMGIRFWCVITMERFIRQQEAENYSHLCNAILSRFYLGTAFRLRYNIKL